MNQNQWNNNVSFMPTQPFYPEQSQQYYQQPQSFQNYECNAYA